jgi:gliding motility-associated-like protein
LDANGAAAVAALEIDSSSSDNCSIATRVLSDSTFDCTEVGTNNITLTVTDPSGNAASTTALITIIDTISPIAVANNISVYLDTNGNATITSADVDGGSVDNCSAFTLALNDSIFDCTNTSAPVTIILTASDPAGNSDTASSIITVIDTFAPNAFAIDTTIYLNSAGSVSISATEIGYGSTDNCGVDSLSINDSTFTCSDLGLNTVYLTVIDVNGNSSLDSGLVTVLDTTSPIAIAIDTTIYLNAAGSISITPLEIGYGSTDNCAIDSLTLSDSTFDCTETGINSITLTVYDVNGNSSTAISNITVLDSLSPIAVAIDTTIYLNTAGNASVTSFEIGSGSSDNCAIVSYSLSDSTFNCADTGANSVTMTVVDASGYQSNASAIITVLDTIAPTAIAQNLTVYLNASGQATINSSQINNGSNDNCSFVTLSLNDSLFDCADLDSTSVILTVTDGSGNTNSDTATITVLDTIAPSVFAFDTVDVYLNAAGVANIVPSMVDSASADACGIDTMYLDSTSFACSNLGSPITVTLSVVDSSGNIGTATSIVNIIDTVAPIAVAQNLTVYLDSNGFAQINSDSVNNGSTSNCNLVSLSLNDSVFDCSDAGSSVMIVLTVVDQSGNSDTAQAFISVLDTIAPAMYLNANVDVYLDASGSATINTSLIDSASFDACGIDTMWLDIYNFGCAEAGLNTVTLSAQDSNGNIWSDSTQINIIDTIAPDVQVVSLLTVALDSFGAVSITPTMIDSATSDACGVANLSLDTFNFSCASAGDTIPVTLTAIDSNGNSASVIGLVSIIDTIAPVVITQNITVYLDSTGQVAITPADIDNGSSDACGIDTYGLNISQFTCGEADSTVEVMLIVTDVNGNTDSNNAQVTVLDTIAPQVIVQNITVTLDSLGEASIAASDINNGSWDSCGIATTSISLDTFDCGNIGPNNIWFFATDVNGNTDSAQAIVTIVDSIAPTILVQNITVALDSFGLASISVNDINNGTWDSCGVDSTFISLDSFNCGNVGSNNIWFYATDIYGNIDSAIATVNVIDTIAPTVLVQNITVALDTTSNANITPADVDNGSWDSCGIATTIVSLDSFDCANIGANSIWFYATDVNGNIDSVIVTVTIIDTIAPIVLVQNITVALDSFGSANILVSDINNGSWDSCGIDTSYLSLDTFNCGNVGNNSIWLIATDVNGNTDSAQAIVTLIDTIAPAVFVQNINVALDSFGIATIAATDIDNGTWDSCGVAALAIDLDTFNCGNIGANTIWFYTTDVNGNTDSTQATVTVVDTIAPTVLVQNITVALDTFGAASITPTHINNGTWDSCGVASTTIDLDTFDCGNVGANTVWFFATDVNGNTDSAQVTVTIIDTIAPTVLVQNITVALDSFGAASIIPADINNGTWDSCGVASTTIDLDTFNCGNVGTNTVWFFATDVNGNIDSASATVTIVDTIAPTVIVQNITVALDSFGTASITAADINNGTWDSCGVASITIDSSNFDCGNIGSNNVWFYATDVNGNIDSAIAVVTITDTIAPTILTQNITIALDSFGDASITVFDVNNGTWDSCGVVSTALSLDTFDCGNVGPNNIWFYATDVNGNTDSSIVTITVLDSIAPHIITQNITVFLDTFGTVSIDSADLNNGTWDSCGVASIAISQNTFGCADHGLTLPVLFTATDVNGNTITDTAFVTVFDTLAPEVLATNDTVYLDASGLFTLDVNTVDLGTNDACGIDSLYLSDSTFTCANADSVETVWFVAIDANGNADSVEIDITVLDTILPEIICPAPIIVANDLGQCGALISYNLPDATDNCSIDSIIQIDTTGLDSGMVFPVGITELTYVAYDHSGNTDTCSFTIEVQDTEAPIITCPSDTSICDTVFTFSLPSFTDNCSGFPVIQIAGINSGDPYPVGTTTNTFVVEDSYGNSDTCSFTVTRFDFPSPATSGVDQSFCGGNSTSMNGNTPAVGTGFWSVISGSATIVDSTVTNTTVNNFINGITELEWRIENGVCPAERDTVSIENFVEPSQAQIVADVSLCDTLEAEIAAVAPTVGIGTWLNPNNDSDIEDTLANVTVVSNLFIDSYTYIWRVSNGVCPSTFDTLQLVNHALPVITTPEVEYIFAPSAVALIATSDDVATWNWTPKQDIINDTTAIALVNPTESRTYFVEGTSQFGCSWVDTVQVEVNTTLEIPTAFTPDGDNYNDVWNIKELANYPECKVEIFTRSGHKIFESVGYETPWDGTDNGAQVDQGAYYFVIRLERDQIIPLTGSITVIR